MSVDQIILSKLGFLDKIFSKKKQFFLFPIKFIRISKRKKRKKKESKVKTEKALDANELLCDNNTLKIYHVTRSDFLKKT